MSTFLIGAEGVHLIRLVYRRLRHWHDHTALVRRVHMTMLAIQIEAARNQWLKEQDDRTHPLRNKP